MGSRGGMGCSSALYPQVLGLGVGCSIGQQIKLSNPGELLPYKEEGMHILRRASSSLLFFSSGLW